MPELKPLPPVGRFAAFTAEEVLTIRAALYAFEIRGRQHTAAFPGSRQATTMAQCDRAARLANESLRGTPLKVPASW